jgi:SnoaL-like domain
MAELTHGDAQDLLAAWKRGWETRNPDLIVDLFDKDADYRPAPFVEPLVGVNAIRRLWNEIAAGQTNVDFDAENIWVAGRTVLVSWHAAYTIAASGERVRVYGFTTMELNEQGLVTRLRQWPVERMVGRDATHKIDGGEQ